MMHLHSEMANDMDCSTQADEREPDEPTVRVQWENRVAAGAPLARIDPDQVLRRAQDAVFYGAVEEDGPNNFIVASVAWKILSDARRHLASPDYHFAYDPSRGLPEVIYL